MSTAHTSYPDWFIYAVEEKHNAVVKLLLSQIWRTIRVLQYSAMLVCSTMQKLSGCYWPSLRCAQRMCKTMIEKLHTVYFKRIHHKDSRLEQTGQSAD